MGDSSFVPEVTIWCDQRHSALAGRVLALMGAVVKPIGVGGPRTAAVDELARSLQCDPHDDFRKMMIDRPATFVLVGTTGTLSIDDIQTALSQGGTVLMLEPLSSSLDALGQLCNRVGSLESGQIAMLPSFARSPSLSIATDPKQVLGKVQMVSFAHLSDHEDNSLFARLFDAWEAVLQFVDLPQSIDASLTGPLGQVPEDLRGITGHLFAHARVNWGCTALVQASDRASGCPRTMQVVGDQGQLEINDNAYQLRDAAGTLLDEHQATNPSTDLADLIAAQWQQLIDRDPAAATSQSDHGHALACCLACQLSARTGQAESPAKFLEIHGLT